MFAPVSFRYLVFVVQFKYDWDLNFLKILSLLDNVLKTQLRTLVRTSIFSNILNLVPLNS